MAAGLGTRMRSATPKHLHPLLGKRVIDWTLDAVRELGADRVVVVVAPGRGGRRRGRRGRRAARAARNRRRGRFREGRARRVRRRRARARRRRAAPDRRPPARARRRARARPARPSPSSPSSRPARSRTAASSATTPARCGRSSRSATRRPSNARSAELNSSIYVFDAAALWPALERLEPRNAQGELYLTDIDRAHRRRREARRRLDRRPTRARPRGSTRAPTWPSAAAILRDRINERAPARRASTIVDPRHDLDRRRRRARARRGRSTRSPSCAARRESPPAPRSARTWSRSTPRSAADALVGPFCYLRPGTVLAAGAKAGTFVEIKNTQRRRGRQGAAPVLHRATRRSARARTSAPGTSPPTSRTGPASRRSGR